MKRNFVFVATAIATCAILVGCGVDPQKATAALNAQGISDVTIGDHAFFGCGESDSRASEFRGTGANGKPVTGVVCSAWLKGITVRYD
ncbi:hypothetical protein [Phyllobacterium myrsinacearum]|uniref:Lipoprotein n=1 Tax=Phyllobacterium myrsinacearum TaxID=28101 RepID=A0A839EWW6_9HYPH|nr:hypothetical protein [Phyllobacterium myrsinacearum]MBA8881796.1 hypothetical protein [Phyllobacterium myrsinacearum]